MGQVGGMTGTRRLRWKRRLGFLVLLTALAISLATFSLAVAALSWVECRSLSRSLQAWQNNVEQQGDKSTLLESIHPDLPQDSGSPGVRLSFLQELLESKRLTRIRRERRKVPGVKNKLPIAAHFEVVPNNADGTYIVEQGGIIRQWSECQLQVKNALLYNNKTGEFTVLKEGLYYMYSQVSPALANTKPPGYVSSTPRLWDPTHSACSHNREPERQALRVERDSERKWRHKQRRRNSLIHLVPSSYRAQGDSTIIHWQKTLHTGESFEQNNSTIAIKGNGYYLIYTQVLYQDQTFVMGHVVKRKEQKRQKEGETLLRCTQNMPEEQPFNTCYSAGIYKLQKGDIIELVIPRNSANIIMEKDSTFMGLMKV